LQLPRGYLPPHRRPPVRVDTADVADPTLRRHRFPSIERTEIAMASPIVRRSIAIAGHRNRYQSRGCVLECAEGNRRKARLARRAHALCSYSDEDDAAATIARSSSDLRPAIFDLNSCGVSEPKAGIEIVERAAPVAGMPARELPVVPPASGRTAVLGAHRPSSRSANPGTCYHCCLERHCAGCNRMT
jgi:hypothetical protein